MTQVIRGETKTLYYYYNQKEQKICIAETRQDLDRKLQQQHIEQETETNKTPEQVAKSMEMIQKNIETLSKQQQEQSQQQLKKLDEQVQQATKDDKTPEEIDKLKQQ